MAAPRTSDAVGTALRDIYAAAEGLPDDMIACLNRIDSKAKTRFN
ncbi:hypothetical protein [Stakelama saccharophila]|uniref:Uncharacterized protein n=1 Tax=Stakelama saccharophila TaxID=3075605 RepID=A0ABZ0BCX9_9SPHN|nr:hypothetical protein [Stakelama sp. W311]WNO54916.1 hypothetical protein RPR59_06630 [Stakelama sp. W311]